MTCFSWTKTALLLSLDGKADSSGKKKCQLSRKRMSCSSYILLPRARSHAGDLTLLPLLLSAMELPLARQHRCAEHRRGLRRMLGSSGVLCQPRNNATAMVMCPSLYVPPRLTSPVWKNLQTQQLFIAPSGKQGLSVLLPGNRILSRFRKKKTP